MANINEFSYNGSAGEFVEIRVDAGDSVTDLALEVYVKTGSTASLDTTIAVSSGAFSSDGVYDYYVISVPLENGPRAAIALTDNGASIDSVTWGSTSPVTVNGGALDGTSQSSIGTPQSNSSTDSIITDGNGGWTTAPPTEGTANICLTSGTLVQTPTGERLVETLQVGDLVKLHDGSTDTIQWIGRRTLNHRDFRRAPEMRPIKISAGALGRDLPTTDLWVSKQHRILVSSSVAHRMFGDRNVLIAAVRLTDLPGIFVDTDVIGVEYIHLMLSSHRVIFANGAPTESLFAGPEALMTIPQAAREELLALFPQIGEADRAPEPCHVIPANQRQKKFVARHLKNQRPVLS